MEEIKWSSRVGGSQNYKILQRCVWMNSRHELCIFVVQIRKLYIVQPSSKAAQTFILQEKSSPRSHWAPQVPKDTRWNKMLLDSLRDGAANQDENELQFSTPELTGCLIHECLLLTVILCVCVLCTFSFWMRQVFTGAARPRPRVHRRLSPSGICCCLFCVERIGAN